MFGKLKTRFLIFIAKSCIGIIGWTGIFRDYYSAWRWALFDYAQRKGLHILPVHYYSPVPILTSIEIDDQTPRYLQASEQILDNAIELLRGYTNAYPEEYENIANRSGGAVTQFEFPRAPFCSVEAEVLYGLIRSRQPNRIVEIGCGHTTLLISEAISDEIPSGYDPEYTCIEPYRPDYLSQAPKEVSQFLEKPLQDIGLPFFETLSDGDVLFIDSSHVVAYGSDTVYEILEILPRLKSGVLIHFHDIFLPYDYPSTWLKESRYFWAEQYFVDTLVRNSARYKVLFPLHQMYRERFENIVEMFPNLAGPKHGPSSYWIEVR